MTGSSSSASTAGNGSGRAAGWVQARVLSLYQTLVFGGAHLHRDVEG